MDGWMDGCMDILTDGRSGPTTRPALAKATQVKLMFKIAGIQYIL